MSRTNALYLIAFFALAPLVTHCDTGLHAENSRVGMEDVVWDPNSFADMAPSYMTCETTNNSSFSTVSIPTVVEVAPHKSTTVPFKLLDWTDDDLSTDHIDTIELDVQLKHHGVGVLWEPCSHRFPVTPINNTVDLDLLVPGLYTVVLRLVPRDDNLCKNTCSEQIEHTLHVVPPVTKPKTAVDPVLGTTTCASMVSDYIATIEWPDGWEELAEIATLESTWEIYDNEKQWVGQAPSYQYTFTGPCAGNPSQGFPCTLAAKDYMSGMLVSSLSSSANFLDPGDIVVLRSRMIVGTLNSSAVLYESPPQTILVPVDCNQQPDLTSKRPVTLKFKKLHQDFPGCPSHATWQCTVGQVSDPDHIPDMISTSKPEITKAYADIEYRYVVRKKGTTSPQVTAESDKSCAWVNIGYHPSSPQSTQTPGDPKNTNLSCVDLGNLATDFLPGDALECVVYAYNPELKDIPRDDQLTHGVGTTLIPQPWTHIIPAEPDGATPNNPVVGYKVGPVQCNTAPGAKTTVLSELCCSANATRCGQPSQEQLRYSWSWHHPGPEPVEVENVYPDTVSLLIKNEVVGFPQAQKGDEICCNVYALEQKPTVSHQTCVTLANAAPMPQKDSVTTIRPVDKPQSQTSVPTLNLATAALCSTNLPPTDPDTQDKAEYQTCWIQCDKNGNPFVSDAEDCKPTYGDTTTQWFTPQELGLKKGDSVACRQFPVDSDGAVGDSPDSSSCEPIENAIPIVINTRTKLMVYDPNPSRSTSFSCSADESDLDNDALQLRFKWQLFDDKADEPLLLGEAVFEQPETPDAIPKDLTWPDGISPEPHHRVVCCAQATETETPEKAQSEWSCDPNGIELKNKPAECAFFEVEPEQSQLNVEGNLTWNASGLADPDLDELVLHVVCKYWDTGGAQQTKIFVYPGILDNTATGKIPLSSFDPPPQANTTMACHGVVQDKFAAAESENNPLLVGMPCLSADSLVMVNNAPPHFGENCTVKIYNDKNEVVTIVKDNDVVHCKPTCTPTDADGDTIEQLTLWNWSNTPSDAPESCNNYIVGTAAAYTVTGCHAGSKLSCSMRVYDGDFCGEQVLTSSQVTYEVSLLPQPGVDIYLESDEEKKSITSAVSGDTLVCVGSLDSAMAFDYQWFDGNGNAVVVGSNSTLDLKSETCWVDTSLKCTTTATGICGGVKSANHSTVTVNNHPPTWNEATQASDILLTVVAPSNNSTATVEDTIQCEFDTQLVEDPDFPACGDSQKPKYTATLKFADKGGTVVEEGLGGTVNALMWSSDEVDLNTSVGAQKGSSIRCCVTVSDGVATSEERCSLALDITNAPPYPPTKVTVSEDPWLNELTCAAETALPPDPDLADTATTAQYSFTMAGESIEGSSTVDLVMNEFFVCNTTTSCQATLLDGEGGESTSAMSQTLSPKGGGSFRFSFEQQTLNAGVSFPSPSGSLSFWVYLESYPTPGSHNLLTTSSEPGSVFPELAVLSDGTPTLSFMGETTAKAGKIPAQTWVPVVISWSQAGQSAQTTFSLWAGDGTASNGAASVTLQASLPPSGSPLPSMAALTWHGSDTFEWAIDEIRLLNTAADATLTVPQFAQLTDDTVALWHVEHKSAQTANAKSYPHGSLYWAPGNGPEFTRASAVDECTMLVDIGPPTPTQVIPTLLSTASVGTETEPETEPQWIVTLQCEVPDPVNHDINGDVVSYYTVLQLKDQPNSEPKSGTVGKFEVILTPAQSCAEFRCGAYATSTMAGHGALTTATVWSNPAVVNYEQDDLNCGGSTDCNSVSCGQETGTCVVAALDDTTVCTDQDPCTTGDQCIKGTCVGGGPTCAESPDPCWKTGCDSNGGCTWTATTALCDDGKECTKNDTCSNGECEGEINCPSTNCNTGICGEDGTCVGTPFADGTSCNDTDACTGTGTCNGGTCSTPWICCTPEKGVEPVPKLGCGQHMKLDFSASTKVNDWYGSSCSTVKGTPEVVLHVAAPTTNTIPWFTVGDTAGVNGELEKPTLLLLGAADSGCKTDGCTDSKNGWLSNLKPTKNQWFAVEGGSPDTDLESYRLGYLCPSNTNAADTCATWPTTISGLANDAKWYCGLKSITKGACAGAEGKSVGWDFQHYGTYSYTHPALNLSTPTPAPTFWAIQTTQDWDKQPRMVVRKKDTDQPCSKPTTNPTCVGPSTAMYAGPWTANTPYCIDIYVAAAQPILVGKTIPQAP